MDSHRVLRLAHVLLASELRSGRSLSNPRSLLGRPLILGVIDFAVFGGVFLLAYAGLRAFGSDLPGTLTLLTEQLLILVPLLAVGATLVAGVMFEFSTGSKFTTSDTVNWLPVTPEEYVAASTLSVAFVYSPAVAFVLGAAFALSLVLGLVPAFLLVTVLSIVALFEGGVLIEMLRAVTQRAASALSGRKGRVTLVLRAILFLVVILSFQLAFNPILLAGLLGAVSGLANASTFIPFFWSTRSVVAYLAGDIPLASLFAVSQVAFVAFLLYLAAGLRVRLWSPAPPEVRLEAHEYGLGHGTLSRFGLTTPEASLVWKDLVGLVRRREMLPIVVTPMVIALIGFLQSGAGGGLDRMTLTLWGPWASGFFALMVATTTLGQERRAIQTLFSYPIIGRTLFRAKVVEIVVLSGVMGIGLDVAIALFGHLPALASAAMGALTVGSILAGTFVGLAVATRYSDFQERPRAQFVRPWAMVSAMLGGLALIFGMVLPGMTWMYSAHPFAPGSVGGGVFALGVAVVSIPVLFSLARSGADRFLDELPT